MNIGELSGLQSLKFFQVLGLCASCGSPKERLSCAIQISRKHEPFYLGVQVGWEQRHCEFTPAFSVQ